jgi:hypothetical protein
VPQFEDYFSKQHAERAYIRHRVEVRENVDLSTGSSVDMETRLDDEESAVWCPPQSL